MEHRGFIKFWRVAEDSKAWSRGIEYRGLIITILSKANYKISSFMGRKIERGQFAFSAQKMAEDLKISRDKLLRMIKNLEEDGFIVREKSHRSFTVLTVCNYSLYQDKENTDRTGTAQEPHINRTATAQEPHTSKEKKKEEIKNINTPLTPQTGEGEVSSSGNSGDEKIEPRCQEENTDNKKPKKKRDPTGDTMPELISKAEAYTQDPALLDELKAFINMRNRIRKPITGHALDILLTRLDSLSAGVVSTKIAILQQSILSSWQGIFPLDGEGKQRNQGSAYRQQQPQFTPDPANCRVDMNGMDPKEFMKKQQAAWVDSVKKKVSNYA